MLSARRCNVQVIARVAQGSSSCTVLTQTEVTSEETAVDARVSRALKPLNGRLEKLWGMTLFHWEEVAGPEGALGAQGIRGLPDVFTPFKEKVGEGGGGREGAERVGV
jgi:hypothetical protein